MLRTLFMFTVAAAVCLSSGSLLAAPADTDMQFFESKIRPLLVERCYKCHSHQEGKNKGDLYLDSRAAILKGGENGPVVVPGDPAKSRLIEAVMYGNVDLQMPPKGKLSDVQVAALSTWIQHGAAWPEEKSPGVDTSAAASASVFNLEQRKAQHWAWQPVKRVDPPTVKNTGWSQDPVDRFLLAKLEEKGIRPAGPADRRTLIRRASFTITGLPPTPTEVEAFAADASPDAFAKLVDRLLASPHFGEHWARRWLDLVRFAETRGHEFDYSIPNAWEYRDYVIRAFNADVPYDQFVTEHIAGDLLPKPRMDSTGTVNESVLATGFWYFNEWVHSPVDIRQDETDRVDNQIDVFGKTFLAVTLGCARCHDHKFDAIGTRDYYAIAGFLHSSSFRNVAFVHESQNLEVAKRLRALDVASSLRVRSALDKIARPALDHLADYFIAAGKIIRNETPDEAGKGLDPAILRSWVIELRTAEKDPADPLHKLATAAAFKDFARQRAFQAAKAKFPLPEKRTAKTIVDYAHCETGQWIVDGDAFGDAPAPAGTALVGPGADRPMSFILGEGAALASNGAALSGFIRTPTFVISHPALSYRVRGKGSAFICIDSHRMISGPLHGVANQSIKTGDAWQTLSADLSKYIGQRAHIEFTPAAGSFAVSWVKLDDSPATDEKATPIDSDFFAVESFDALARQYAGIIGKHWQSVIRGELHGIAQTVLVESLLRRLDCFGYSPDTSGPVNEILKDDKASRRTLLAELKHSPTAMAMLDGSPVDEHVLIRGSHKTPGEVVPRRFMQAIDGPGGLKSAGGSGRLELARRVNDPANPLTSRVIVNRVWHHIFGRGIVVTTDNFGMLGEKPTHPELLDFLADGFVQDQQSLKRLIRRLMLTRAWQMSSHETDAGTAAIDPQNLLLHRANLRRLESESIRDEILAVSGRLDGALFGQSVDVFLTPFMEGRGRPGTSGPLDGAGRRSIYTRVRRNFLSPMMLAFDTPQPFNTMGRRANSNVPAQALILMNDPFVVQQAELWARRVLADPSLTTPAQRIDQMYRAAFARPPSDTEQSAAERFLKEQGIELGVAAGQTLTDVRLWSDLAHVLMNVKEFIYVP